MVEKGDTQSFMFSTSNARQGILALFANDTVAFAIKRLLQGLLTLLLASALSFALVKLAPGDELSMRSQSNKNHDWYPFQPNGSKR